MSALEVPAADPAAVFARLYADLHGKLLTHVRHKVGDPEAAEDICQDVWGRISEKLPEYLGRPGFNGPALVYQSATNKALDHLRRGGSKAAGGRVRFSSLDAELDQAGGASEAAAVMVERLTPEVLALGAEADAGVRGLLGVCMEGLPARLRRALWLQVYGGLDLEALGATLGVTASAAKSMVFRARETLRVVAAKEARARAAGRGAVRRLDLIADRSPGPAACWPWRGSLFGTSRLKQPAFSLARLDAADGSSRRRLSISGRRARWALAHGPIPPWTDVVAVCRTEGCTNPAHLAAAAARSPDGAAAADRLPAGEPIPPGPELAARRRAAGVTRRALARRIGCSTEQIEDMERASRGSVRERRYRDQRMRARLPEGQLWLGLRRRVAAALPVVPPEVGEGPALRARRRALGLTLLALAAEAGCGKEAIRRMETGWVPAEHRAAPPAVAPVKRTRARILAALDRLERERAGAAA